MNDFKAKAIEISNKFPFSEFESSAQAIDGHKEAENNVAACENHLDVDFMKLLEQGSHLDFIEKIWLQ